MDNLNERRIRVLKETVHKVKYLIDPICKIREDRKEIKDAEWREKVEQISKDIISDQMLLFIGPYSSGKSTFVNALLGAPLLPTAARPCTSVVMELSFKEGGGHKGKLFLYDGKVEESDFDTIMDLVNGPRGAVGRVMHIHHIELVFDITTVDDWETHPLATLKNLGVKVVDCPGYGSPYITREDAIEEYIQKASFTFWMSPADNFGGLLAENKLRDIKKKTSALIPVITMSDKIDDFQRQQVKEDFEKYLAPLFPKNKEPRFVSAVRYFEAVELAQKLNKDRDSITREEIEKIQAKIDKLKEEAGLENVYGDMVRAGERRQVADSKINSARFDLNDLLKDMGRCVEKDLSYWKTEAEKIGWNESDEYKKLNEIKNEVDNWIKAQSKSVAGVLETAMIKEIADYSMHVKGKVESSQVQYIVMNVWEEEINKHKDAWGDYLCKKYKEYTDGCSAEFSDKTRLKPPDTGSVMAGFANTTLSIMEAFRYAGPQTLLTAGLGTALMLSTSAVAQVALVGGALSTLFAIIGPACILVAGVGLFPIIRDLKIKRDEQTRKKMEDELRQWMKNLDVAPTIQVMLNKENEQLYKSYKDAFYGASRAVVGNLEECQRLKEEISDICNLISEVFPEESRKGL